MGEKTRPDGWEGEGLPTAQGPGFGKPQPKQEERFPTLQDAQQPRPADLAQAHELVHG